MLLPVACLTKAVLPWCVPVLPPPHTQVQISTLQEELAAAYSDNAALRARLEAATNITAATQQDNERLRAEAARLR